MPLEPGTTLGVYEVLSAIGAGGMGEVYKARDTKLDRDVALKILPDAFVNDAERLARFQREAKVLASLNHPNIAQIHGLEEGGDSPALVLEYVEGPTLQDRISQGPIPMDEALPIARQIAEALEAAHEQGIIHRDLKPANVKVRSDGTVKVLDFGLAKALQPELSDTEAANSPTMTAAATRAGIIMGTAAYMAPEQAKGRQVDKRADIWAFGVVLFEMLTGRQAFGGTDISETLAFVLTREIEWTALPTKTPASVRRMLRRCVARDRKNRLADMSMARLEIDEADAAPETPAVAVTTPVAPPALWQRPVFASAALVLALITGGLVVWSVAGGDQPAPRSAMRLSVALPPTVEVTGTHNRIALSGDGRVVVFNGSSEGTSQLYRRSLDQPDAVPIAGTEDAVAPFLSPDGEWVGFAVGHELKKVSLVGGPPLTICALDDAFRLASWGPDDTVVFGTEYSGLWQVSAAGGEPQELTTPDTEAGEIFHIAPSILPGGHTVLFWSAGSDGNRVELLQKDSGERRVLVEDGASPHYVTTGHVVFSRGDSLWATPFDLDELSVTGAPFLVLEGVQDLGTFGGTQFGVARDGTLVYVTGPYRVTAQRTLAWVDRKGNEEAIDVPPRAYIYARLSPDGTRIALDSRDEENDIWIWDLARETLQRLTFDPGLNRLPLWAPDGSRIAFTAQRDAGENIYWQAADGSGTAERLFESPSPQGPKSFSPDGTHLVFSQPLNPPYDIGVITLEGDRKAELLLQTPFNETNGEIAPDGQWLAYESNESGQSEIYVRPFPDVDTSLRQVSTTGGTRPLWSRDGRELFYYVAPDRIMAVTVAQSGGDLILGRPEVVVQGPYATPMNTGRHYDVSQDGQRFLLLRPVGGTETDSIPSRINVVLNWYQELLERVPVP